MKREKLFNRDVFVFENRPHSINEMFLETVNKYPNKEAIVMGNNRLTYSELKENVQTIAKVFQHYYRLNKGDRVALLMENKIEFVQAFLACATLGIIVVPLNARCTEEELTYMINHADVQLICAEKGYESLLEKWQDKDSQRHVIMTDQTTFSGKYEKFQSLFAMAKRYSKVTIPKLKEEDPLYILFTSGTTGKPKGAVGSHVNAIHSVISYRKVLQLKNNTRTLIAIPLFHVTGLIGQLLFMIFIGGTSILMHKFKTDAYLKLIEREQVTFLFNVPAIYIMMMNHEIFQTVHLESVETIAYGGAPMSKETIEKLMYYMPGLSLHNAYGATETTSPASIMPKKNNNLSKLTSVGQPVPVAEMKIIGERGEILNIGEIGELYIKGPMIIEGYWRNDEANYENFKDGYWKSGDMAMIDEDNYLYIMDRRKDMINRGGEKVFSAEVENVLYEHPAVLEAAVIGIPDEIFGEEVKAFIVLRENENVSDSDIQSFLKKRLAKFKVPKYIEFIKTLPRNAGGKILKAELT